MYSPTPFGESANRKRNNSSPTEEEETPKLPHNRTFSITEGDEDNAEGNDNKENIGRGDDELRQTETEGDPNPNCENEVEWGISDYYSGSGFSGSGITSTSEFKDYQDSASEDLEGQSAASLVSSDDDDDSYIDAENGGENENTEYDNISDLINLSEISVDAVQECIKTRFLTGKYCTFAGSVLIALNPCLKKNSVCTDINLMSQYIQQLHNSTEKNILEPHVFSVGVKSLKNLRTIGNDQVVIVSGDSGAGKTTCTQHLIQFLSYANNTQTLTSALENKIYYATIILEAFGNASTVANPNSSRFGRLVQLHYDKANNISGAEIKTYLLEKHRVAKCAPNERNFHIFYYMIQGIAMNYLSTEGCGIPESFRTRVTDSDMKDFVTFMKALTWFDIHEEFEDVFAILHAIMELTALRFVKEGNENKPRESSSTSNRYAYTVLQRNLLKDVCKIFGISDKLFEAALVSRSICPANRQSVICSPCKSERECETRLQAFTATLYEQLFHFILNRVNSLLRNDDAKPFTPGNQTHTRKISLLDLYGFESLEYNHLEQMCINYANERLQQVQISVLKASFEEEKQVQSLLNVEVPVELNRVDKEINSRIDEIGRFLFSKVDEECLLKRIRSDASVFEEMSNASQKHGLKFIKCIRKRAAEVDYQFVIKHYATEVTYNFNGMVEKNKDNVPEEFTTLLSKSSSSLISKLFPRALNRFPVTPKSAKSRTIFMRFKSSVNELMKELSDGHNKDIRFIRCIRPNASLIEGQIEPELLRTQLHSCGIVDIIRITGNGFPIRISVEKFQPDYRSIYRGTGNDIDQLKKRLMILFSFPEITICVGNNFIFMNELAVKMLRKYDHFILNMHAKNLQRIWRKRKASRIELTKKTPNQQMQSSNQSLNSFQTCQTNTTLWYTPMMESGDESSSTPPWHNSTPMTSGGSGLRRLFNSTLLNNTGSSNMELSGVAYLEDQSDGAVQDMSSTLRSFIGRGRQLTFTKSESPKASASEELKVFKEDKFVKGNGIISRIPLHSLPIKVYTKKTALGLKQPQRLIANGVQDAFEEYGIIMRPE